MVTASKFSGDIYQSEMDSHAKAHLLTTSDLAKYYHLPINEAAKEMDICTSVLKKICRKKGIKRWPHRKFKSLDRLITSLDDKEQVEQLKQKRELLLTDPNIEYTAIIPKSKLNSCNSFISKVKGPTKTIKKDTQNNWRKKKASSPIPTPLASTTEVDSLVSQKPVQLFAQLPFLVKKEESKTTIQEVSEPKTPEEVKTETVSRIVKEESMAESKPEFAQPPAFSYNSPVEHAMDCHYDDDATEEDENLPMEIGDCKLEASADGNEIVNNIENRNPIGLLYSAPRNQEPMEAPKGVKYKEQLRLSTNSLAQFNAILADCRSFISYGRVL